MKYSIWELVHESCWAVTAYKIKDTNSTKVLDEYINKGYSGSFYREQDEINAMYLQMFEQD